LAALLAEREPPAGLWRPDELGAIFHHQMSAPLLADLGEVAQPIALGLGDQAAGKGTPLLSFADLLRHPSPPPELLGKVKDFAKTNADHSENGLPKEVAAIVYYACIAAGMVRLKTRISRLSDGDLVRGLRWAREQPWLDEPTRQLLDAALAGMKQAGAREAFGS
jgi:hypothetical protein